jgi:glycosyltransferase involved in cell wall biosynthesis
MDRFVPEEPVVISVIVPSYNSCEYLDLTLAAFAIQSYRDYEVIVVDDGSTDATPEVARRYAGQLNLNYVHQDNRGRAGARNTGLQHATGEIVFFNDDDRLPAPNLLQAHAQAHRTGNEVVIGQRGRVLSVLKKELPLRGGEFARVLKDHGVTADEVERGEKQSLICPQDLQKQFESVIARMRLEDDDWNVPKILAAYSNELKGYHFAWALGTTANMSVAREHVLTAGAFDENYRGWGMEDVDLAYRLHQMGLNFVIVEQALNYHQVHPLRSGGAGNFPKHEMFNNFAYFCRKYDTLECYFFWKCFDLDQAGQWAKLDPISANTVMGKLLEMNDALVQATLLETYRELLTQSLAFYRIVNRIKTTRTAAVEAH